MNRTVEPTARRLAAATALVCAIATATAQTWDSISVSHPRVDTARTGQLRAEMDALVFFQNNEYSSPAVEGYTLPGAWLQPRLTYTPLPRLRIEAGAHLLFFNGATHYPNYAYHDIARWKAGQYQSGVHALPFLRVQADFQRLSLVMGNIHGAQSHGLILPLYNPEQNLSADPEAGVQLIYDSRRAHADLWLNWQSFIFNLDTHQEAFTVGLNYTPRWNGGGDGTVDWETPVQLIGQHRGGEIDATNTGVQTVWNAAAGVRATWRPYAQGALNSLRAEANALFSYQQTGDLWPFAAGFAWHAALRGRLWGHMGAEVGYFAAPRRFANLYGSPFFSTLSVKTDGLTFDGARTAYATVSYDHGFGRNYHLGAQLDVYATSAGGATSTPFGFGVYFRVSPSFRVGK